MRKLLFAALLSALPMGLSAQIVKVVGTEQNAPTVFQPIGMEGDGLTENFYAEGSQLNRLSIWFDFGAAPDLGSGYGGYFAFVQIDKGQTFESGFLARTFIPPSTNGRFDWVFDTPLEIQAGTGMSFTVWVNNCGERTGNCAVPIGAVRPPSLEVTTGEAFYNGQMRSTDGSPPHTPQDIRFEAQFTLPEPANVILLLSACVPLSALLLRRRNCI